MKTVIRVCMSILAGIGVRAEAGQVTFFFGFTSSDGCIASSQGFTASLPNWSRLIRVYRGERFNAGGGVD